VDIVKCRVALVNCLMARANEWVDIATTESSCINVDVVWWLEIECRGVQGAKVRVFE
jgi:hypothetical protein